MTVHRWPGHLPPDALGAVVAGPVVLGRAPGIAAGLRCVYAYPEGLLLPFVLRARGVQAEAACRRHFPRKLYEADKADKADKDASSDPLVIVEVDGLRGVADPAGMQASGGGDAYDQEGTFWIGRLPETRRVVITVAWPEAGLPESVNEVALDLHQLGQRVVALLGPGTAEP